MQTVNVVLGFFKEKMEVRPLLHIKTFGVEPRQTRNTSVCFSEPSVGL